MEDPQTHHQIHAQKSSINQRKMKDGEYDFAAVLTKKAVKNLFFIHC